MNISIVSSSDTHQIKFYEFLTPSGKTITSFFQAIEVPGNILGCVDTYEEALSLIGCPPNSSKYIKIAYLDLLGVNRNIEY